MLSSGSSHGHGVAATFVATCLLRQNVFYSKSNAPTQIPSAYGTAPYGYRLAWSVPSQIHVIDQLVGKFFCAIQHASVNCSDIGPATTTCRRCVPSGMPCRRGRNAACATPQCEEGVFEVPRDTRSWTRSVSDSLTALHLADAIGTTPTTHVPQRPAAVPPDRRRQNSEAAMCRSAAGFFLRRTGAQCPAPAASGSPASGYPNIDRVVRCVPAPVATPEAEHRPGQAAGAKRKCEHRDGIHFFAGEKRGRCWQG